MKTQLVKYIVHPFSLFLLLLWMKVAFVRAILLDGSLAYSFYIELPVLILMLGFIELLCQKKPRIRFTAYIVLDFLLTFVLFSMVLYYQYYGTIVTYTSLLNLNQVGEVSDSIMSLMRPEYVLLLVDIPLILIVVALVKQARIYLTRANTHVHGLYGSLVLIIMAVLALLNTLHSIGGGTVNELRKAEGMGLFTYEAYVVYLNVKGNYIPIHEITPRSVRQLKGLSHVDEPEFWGIAKDNDVYIIQLESFQNFLIGLKINEQEVTPNLNQLIGESIYFDRFYQQIAKGNTSDAEFVTNTSIYPTGILPMSQQAAGRVVPSMPRYLKRLGYDSVTLHVNDITFWSRDSMYPALGFDEYYDRKYFGEEDIVALGASDDVLYRKSIDVFRQMKDDGKKIYANLISLSSHNPFEMPEDKVTIQLPEELQGTFLGHYIEACHYADQALGGFISGLKENGLWDSAMLVIYGDHFGFSTENAPAAEQEMAAELIGVPQYAKTQMFNIPLIIRVPAISEGIEKHNIGGQIDTLPTIANLLGLDLSQEVIFGQDLMNHDHNAIGERVYLPSGSFINEDAMFIPGKGLEDGTILPLDPEQEIPSVEAYRHDYNTMLALLRMSDSYVHALPVQKAIPVDETAAAK